MILDFAKNIMKLQRSCVKAFGQASGETFFNRLLDILKFKIRMKAIHEELDLYHFLYTNTIFKETISFYDKHATKNPLTPKERRLINTIDQIVNCRHTFSDEVTLLFYVGLYHKIENYENEILAFYNLLNNTQYKSLKSIGINIAEKKRLFNDRDRIRLICNSIKHNNYYPKKDLLNYYPDLQINKKITLSDFNPSADIDLIKLYVNYFNMLIIFKNLLSLLNETESFGDKDLNDTLQDYYNEFLKDNTYKDTDLEILIYRSSSILLQTFTNGMVFVPLI